MTYESAILDIAASGKSLAQIRRDIKTHRLRVCVSCDAVATRYCDFILGHSSWKMDGERKVFDISSLPERCDAPMCEQCKTQVGSQFFCGTDGCFETVDFCNAHIGKERLQRETSFCTKGGAESQRLKTWKMKYLQKGLTTYDRAGIIVGGS